MGTKYADFAYTSDSEFAEQVAAIMVANLEQGSKGARVRELYEGRLLVNVAVGKKIKEIKDGVSLPSSVKWRD